jgi:hypothetical protein
MQPLRVSLLALSFALLLPLSAAAQTVLFDQGHGQLSRIDRPEALQLSALAGLFQTAGWQVESAEAELSTELLAGVDALILSGPFEPYTPAEEKAILRFLKRGGRLAVMLHIGRPTIDLLHRLGISQANGVVRERQDVLNEQALDFKVSRLEPHPLFAGLEAFYLFGGWPLLNDDERAQLIAFTGPQAWVDLNRNNQLDAEDAVQTFAVAATGSVGRGAFVVFGDDAIFQNRYLQEYNAALGRNLVEWLGGEE